MSGKPNHMSDLRTAAAHPLASGTGEGHMIAAADARAIQGYGHDKDSGGEEEDDLLVVAEKGQVGNHSVSFSSSYKHNDVSFSVIYSK